MDIWHNGEFMAIEEARVSPASAGVLYGWGVFTTLGVTGGEPRAFDRHWQRLAAHAGRAGVPLEWAEADVKAGLVGLVARNGVGEGRARVTVLRSSAGPWQAGGGPGSDVVVFAAAREPREARALRVTVSPYRLNTRWPLAGIKCTAYAGHLLALEEARDRGFDEALLLNERGEVSEATAANVFWVRDGELYTPSLATGCLSGVTRRLVLEAAARLRVRVVEGGFGLPELGAADELFLTNSTSGLVPAGEFDIHRFGSTPSMDRIRTAVEALLA